MAVLLPFGFGRKRPLKEKGKIIRSLVISFLFLVLFFASGNVVAAEMNAGLYFVNFFFSILFPFGGAYALFCYCYSGKLYLTEGTAAPIVVALFGIIPALVVFTSQVGHRYWFEDLGCCFVATPLYKALGELNYRENWRWADILQGGRQFQTDSELDGEIVNGKTLSGWNTDLGSNFVWAARPNATGGTITYRYGKRIVLYRTPATLATAATWSTRSREP